MFGFTDCLEKPQQEAIVVHYRIVFAQCTRFSLHMPTLHMPTLSMSSDRKFNVIILCKIVFGAYVCYNVVILF